MESLKPIWTPVIEWLELKKEGSRELINPTYFKSIVSDLRYLTCTRPDITYGIGIISQVKEESHQSHLQVAKPILHYISGTHDNGIFYTYSNNSNLVEYTYNDWIGDVKT